MIFGGKKSAKYTEQAKLAANRWTENIFSLQSWVANNFSIEMSAFNKQFNIPEDFDTIA